MLNNKKIYLVWSVLLLAPLSYASIVGVGQVGSRYVYKVNDILVSVSAGDVIDGCTVKAGSGLQCAQPHNSINNKNIGRDLSHKVEQLDLAAQLTEKNNEIEKIKLIASQKIRQKNEKINQLSHQLNTRR